MTTDKMKGKTMNIDDLTLKQNIREDIHKAEIAAVLEKVVDWCDKIADRDLSPATADYAAGYSDGADRCAEGICDLTPNDAKAALEAVIQEAVLAERERCAQVAYRWCAGDEPNDPMGSDLAAAIRKESKDD